MVRAIRLAAVLVCLAIPASVAAQSADLAGYKLPHDVVKGNLIKSAEAVAEADYAFKPTPEVRSFGQLFGHVANANFMICANAAGEPSPATGDAEKLTAKADIQKALADSFAYCDTVWASLAEPGREAWGSEPVDLFGMKLTRASALAFNSAHDWEHYGNVVTYMRLKGMVPPSSQGRD